MTTRHTISDHATFRDSAVFTPASSTTTKRLIPVPHWNDHHDWPPPGGLRHLIFHAQTNGFASAFKRVGRRVLVDEAEFFRCVEENDRKATL